MLMKYQLALEGGGAKGAYHVGVLKALLEHGYEFDAVVGASIGALNGVMIAQDKYFELYELWKNIRFSKLFDFPDEYAQRLAERQVDKDTLAVLFKNVFNQFKKGGIDTAKTYDLIKNNIDEELLRKSKVQFGLMTYNLTKKAPMPCFVEDIPEGKIADYVMASASFPGFKTTVIENEKFLDGGIYDNLPINMLIDKGYRNIIAIKTGATSRCQKVNYVDNLKLQYIVPSEKPGRLLDFNPKSVNRGLLVGYYDGLRFCRNYLGFLYYIKDFNVERYWVKFDRYNDEELDILYRKIFNKDPNDLKGSAKKINFDIILHELVDILKIKNANLKDKKIFFVVLLEEIAKYYLVERLQVLSVDELIEQINSHRDADIKSVKKKKSDLQLVLESAYTCLF